MAGKGVQGVLVQDKGVRGRPGAGGGMGTQEDPGPGYGHAVGSRCTGTEVQVLLVAR